VKKAIIFMVLALIAGMVIANVPIVSVDAISHASYEQEFDVVVQVNH